LTLVPWTRLEADRCENFVSIMLCRENPSAVRVRPSRGDGGIDVILVTPEGWLVDQIKYFSENLSDAQKRQITHSYDRLREYAAEKGAQIAEWRLVLPLDPTNENREWFSVLTKNADYSCEWRGLTHLEGLAAKYPDVIDYYLKDGKNRVMELVGQMVSLLGVHKEGTSDVENGLQPVEAVDTIVHLYKALNAGNCSGPCFFELSV
jgi:hypothetical protein